MIRFIIVFPIFEVSNKMKSRNKLFVPFSLVLFLIFAVNIAAQDFKFVAMSDSRGSDNGVNDEVLSALVNHMVTKQQGVKFIVFPGDMVSGSRNSPKKTMQQLNHWKEIMSPIYNDTNMVWPKIWLAVGNHEVQNSSDEKIFKNEFQDVFMNGPSDEKGLTYSFDYNRVHFVFITTDRWHYSEADEISDDGSRDWHYVKHLDWLKNDLQKARERGNKFIFVMSHETAFPIGGHLRDGLPNLGRNLKLPLDSTRHWYINQRDKFWKILSENKVSAYICGHEHLYGRESIDSVYQITSSCGAPLYHFNSTYGDNPIKKLHGQELTYNEALPYYKVLNYNYQPGGNAQASKDFVGRRAFVYVLFHVKSNEVDVKTFGAFPKKGTRTKLGGKIKLLDSFTLKKRL